MLFEFVGPSYQFRSTAFDHQRSINLYPDKSETGTSKGHYVLCPTPGRQLFGTIAAQPIRGMWYASGVGRAFVVAYNILYELFPDGTSNALGNLATFSGNVSMSDNGLQLIIVDGTTTGGWIFTFATNAYVQITAMGFRGGVTVTFIDGYFLLNVPNSQEYQWSSLYDGTLWDATDFAAAEGSPDNLLAVVTTHRQVFLVGASTTEVIYNSGGDQTGTSTDPFDSVQGIFIQYGTIASFSVKASANSIFFIGADTDGVNVVWQIDQYAPTRISTEAIENYISQYDTTQAVGYSYQEDGHYFIEWNIPGMPTSIVYDVEQQQWHERARWNSDAGMYERDRAQLHMYCFGKHLVSDYETGDIYQQSLDFNMDDDFLVRRVRILPYFTDDLEYLYFSQFQIDMQTGVGLETDSDIANTDPQINLRWSDDSGNTWSTEISVPLGKVGQYRTRAIWRRLGRSRFRIFEASVIANVPVYMIAAHLDVSKGYA